MEKLGLFVHWGGCIACMVGAVWGLWKGSDPRGDYVVGRWPSRVVNVGFALSAIGAGLVFGS